MKNGWIALQLDTYSLLLLCELIGFVIRFVFDWILSPLLIVEKGIHFIPSQKLDCLAQQ